MCYDTGWKASLGSRFQHSFGSQLTNSLSLLREQVVIYAACNDL
jgi:hypothetical protein